MSIEKLKIHLRFEQLPSIAGYKSTNAFGIAIGKSAQSIGAIQKGANKPSFDMLVAVFSACPNISMRWLILGEGKPLVSENLAANEKAAKEKKVDDEMNYISREMLRLRAEQEELEKRVDLLE